MKIDKVIFTIDDNPHYFDFWASISKHYKLRMDIVPKLFIIGNNVDVSKYNTTYGSVEVVKPVDNVPTIIQALIGKFYFTSFEPETTWIIGDLDLYPLQQDYFRNIKDIPDDEYVHLNPYAYGLGWRNGYRGLAGYYHVAKGRVFKEELGFNRTFDSVVNEVFLSNRWGIKFYNLGASIESHQASKDWGWFCCEEMYTGDLLKNCKKLVEISPLNGCLLY